jgi:hypothetical protein
VTQIKIKSENFYYRPHTHKHTHILPPLPILIFTAIHWVSLDMKHGEMVDNLSYIRSFDAICAKRAKQIFAISCRDIKYF